MFHRYSHRLKKWKLHPYIGLYNESCITGGASKKGRRGLWSSLCRRYVAWTIVVISYFDIRKLPNKRDHERSQFVGGRSVWWAMARNMCGAAAPCVLLLIVCFWHPRGRQTTKMANGHQTVYLKWIGAHLALRCWDVHLALRTPMRGGRDYISHYVY